MRLRSGPTTIHGDKTVFHRSGRESESLHQRPNDGRIVMDFSDMRPLPSEASSPESSQSARNNGAVKRMAAAPLYRSGHPNGTVRSEHGSTKACRGHNGSVSNRRSAEASAWARCHKTPCMGLSIRLVGIFYSPLRTRTINPHIPSADAAESLFVGLDLDTQHNGPHFPRTSREMAIDGSAVDHQRCGQGRDSDQYRPPQHPSA